jgi:DNA-binding NtrC family response regulator
VNATSVYPAFPLLLVDDELPWLRSLRMTLEGPGAINNLRLCQDSREVMGLLAEGEIGLVLLDLTMPHLSGEELLARVVEEHPEVTVIILSGMNQIETAVRCMKLGAFDYFVKTTEEDRLLDGVRRAIRMQELQRENRQMRRLFLNDTLEHPEAFADIVTNNKGMRSICQYVEAVAPSTQPVLITGESGVGKELFARAVHALSRRSGPLVSVNVAGLDDNVFADALFGHTRGAFTGADAPRRGMIEEAGDGTLFLDEIGDLSIASQVKLLRLLQEGEYFPLGSDKPKQSRARIVVATHQDLTAKQAAKQFRKDLYFRLRAHHVHIPPLRERKDDLPLLLDHSLAKAAAELGKKKPTTPPELVTLLSTYAFPGNVRELEAMVYDAVSVHGSRVLSMQTFRQRIGQAPAQTEIPAGRSAFAGIEPLPNLGEAVEQLIAEAMQRANGNQSIASRLLGISQPALSKRLKQQQQRREQPL